MHPHQETGKTCKDMQRKDMQTHKRDPFSLGRERGIGGSLERKLCEFDKVGNVGILGEAALLVKPERVHEMV